MSDSTIRIFGVELDVDLLRRALLVSDEWKGPFWYRVIKHHEDAPAVVEVKTVDPSVAGKDVYDTEYHWGAEWR